MKYLNPSTLTNLLMASILALTSTPFSFALADSPPRSKPLPPVTTIQAAKGESINDFFSFMGFSEKFDSSSPRAIGEQSPMAYVAKRIADFTAAKKAGPKSNKYILKADFYGFDDPTVVAPTENAVKSGIATQVITDFNQYLTCDEPTSTDWQKCKVKPGTMGDALTKMLTFLDFNAIPNGIASQPVYNKGGKDQMIDIYHRKQLFTITEENGKPHIDYDFMTSNMTPNARVNRWWSIADQDFAQYASKHFDDTFTTFQRGGKIKDIPNTDRLRKNYDSGQWVELGFTDGGFNLNDRLGALLDFVIATPAAAEVELISGAEFAPTKADLFTKMFNVLKLYPNSRMKMISDLRFTGVSGYGQLERGAGFDDFREMGGAVFGVGAAVAKQIQSYVYSAPAVDPTTGQVREQTVLDGAPTDVKVLHDKTIKMRLVIKDADSFNKTFGTNFKNGQRVSFILTGSFNLSNHATNAEAQIAMFVDADSWVDKAIDESIDGIIKYQPLYCLEMVTGMTRAAIAKLNGMATDEIPLEMVKKVREAMLARDFSMVINELHSAENLPSNIKTRPKKDVVDASLSKVETFLTWYKANVPLSTTDDAFRMRKLAVLADLVTDQSGNAYKTTARLNSILWRPGLSEAQTAALMAGAWKALGLPGEPAASASSKDAVAGPNTEKAASAPRRGTRPPRATGADAPPAAADGALASLSSPAVATAVDSTTPTVNASVRAPVAPIVPAAATSAQPTAHFYILDFDDNFAITSRRIFVRTKDTKHVVALSTAKWAVVSPALGNEGTWKNYETFDGSFREFVPGQLRSHIGNEKTPILKNQKGPSYKAMQEACSTAEGASHVFFNTAGPEPTEIHNYLLELQKAGELKFVPPIENILTGATDPQKKVDNVRKVAKIANETPIPANAVKVLTPDGSDHRAMNLLGFSDDSPINFETVLSALTADEIQKLFPNVKTTVFYTGTQDKSMRDQALVVSKDGPRQQLAVEVDEYSVQRQAVVENNNCADLLKKTRIEKDKNQPNEKQPKQPKRAS